MCNLKEIKTTLNEEMIVKLTQKAKEKNYTRTSYIRQLISKDLQKD